MLYNRNIHIYIYVLRRWVWNCGGIHFGPSYQAGTVILRWSLLATTPAYLGSSAWPPHRLCWVT